MLIIYGISIEGCVFYKCNADRWSCTCFRNGVWGGGFVVKVWFFKILLEQTNYSYFFLKENHNAHPKTNSTPGYVSYGTNRNKKTSIGLTRMEFAFSSLYSRCTSKSFRIDWDYSLSCLYIIIPLTESIHYFYSRNVPLK